MDGVNRVEPSARRHTVSIDLDESVSDLDDVFEALGEAGYSVTRFEKMD